MDICDLYVLMEKENITVINFDLPQTISQSQMDSSGKCYIGIDKKLIPNEAEERVRVAHEGGHCITGAFYNRYSKLNVVTKQEHKANKWAIKKLVTEDELHEAVSQGYTEMWELAEYFDIPQDFMKKIVCEYEGLEW